MPTDMYVLETEIEGINFHIGYKYEEEEPHIEDNVRVVHYGGKVIDSITYVELVVGGKGLDITRQLTKEQIEFFENQIIIE